MFKTKTKTLKNESGDVLRPRLKSREPQLWILNSVKIEIMHNSAPVNLHSSINVTGMSRWLNVCPICYLGQPIFRDISTMANSAVYRGGARDDPDGGVTFPDRGAQFYMLC